MTVELESGWKAALNEEFEKPYFKDLVQFLNRERESNCEVYPPRDLVFNAFNQTPFSAVKVVIMGQDPYHGPGQAHGLSFSVPEGVPLPPSLKNIFLEIQQDLQIARPTRGSLLPWAHQGVLLLNATLTVRAHEPKSHYNQGWEMFTNAVIAKLMQREDPLIFVLWGNSAKEKMAQFLSVRTEHVVLTAAHPSPFSAHNGFFGCKHFSKINALLTEWGKQPIQWVI